jgi:Ca-activated chloride channel family protein
MRFEQPWALLLLGLIPLLHWFRMRRPQDAAVRFFSTEPVAGLRVTGRARLARLPYWLRVAALCLFVLALARPKSGGDRQRETGQGIGIFLVIDRSPSMDLPISFEGRHTTRLALAKKLLQQFASGGSATAGTHKGRPSDPIGIVAFARQPETVCPLTFAHDSFAGLLQGVHAPPSGHPEGFTAIGDAVVLAAARLKNSPQQNLKSKVIILLTDGENTAGAHSPVEGAQVAARWGVRIHAIGIAGGPPSALPNSLGVQQRFIAERDLNQMAAISGGIYRSAHDGEALQSIYAEIDKLEKSEVARTKFTGGTEEFAIPLQAALALLVSSSLLSASWLRRIP